MSVVTVLNDISGPSESTYPCKAKNCQIWWKFDVVITKIILLVFLRHGVYTRVCNHVIKVAYCSEPKTATPGQPYR